MKKYLFLVSAIMAFCLGSCTKDDTISNLGATTGDEIKFVASITDNTTRTVYGEYDATNKSYPLYWVTGDKVAVYSPQALSAPISGEVDASQTYAGPADVTYTVGTTSNSNTYALSGDAANLYWGTGEGNNGTHEFYTFYPSRTDRIYKKDTDGNFVVTVPREQNATVTQNGNTYTAVDMSAAIMAGYTTVDRNTYNGEEIVLPFTPLTTAFDIEILPPTNKLPEGTTGIDKVTITSITIANPSDVTTNRKILAGGFIYNAKNAKNPENPENPEKVFSHYTNSSTTEDANAYTVNIQLSTPVTLESGSDQKLIVTGFLLPHIMYASGDTTDTTLRIMINCREGENSGAMKVHSKDISWTSANKATYEMKKSTVKLGELPNPIVFSYETWMANLPDDTYVSQISMPGTHDAGAYPADTDSGITNFFTDLFAQTQDISIIEQLNQGVRVLDFRPKYRTSTNDFNIAHGAANYNNRTFDIVMNDMLSWLAKHPTEFVIVLLKNEYGAGDWDYITNKPVFLGWIKNINAKLRTESYAKYTIAEFDPEMTLKEARGKMLYMSRDYYAPTNISDTHYANVESDWGTYQHYYTDYYGCKISGWSDNAKYDSGNNKKSFFVYNPESKYTPESERNYEKSVGEFYYSDFYKRTIALFDAAVSADNKTTEIESALTGAKNNSGSNYKDVWYMTWLNVYGSSESRSNDHNSQTATYITNNFSTQNTYQRTGIVMADWISNTEGKSLVKAVIDNNFKGDGPAKKTN